MLGWGREAKIPEVCVLTHLNIPLPAQTSMHAWHPLPTNVLCALVAPPGSWLDPLECKIPATRLIQTLFFTSFIPQFY